MLNSNILTMFKKLNIFKKKTKKTWENAIYDDYLIEQLDEIKTDLNSDNLQVRKDLHHLLKYFNKSPFIYTLINYDNIIIKSNNTFKSIINESASKILGKSIIPYLHDDDINQFKFLLDKLEGKEKTQTLRLITNTGELYYIKWHGVKLEEEQMYLLIGQDITKEVELEEKVRKIVNYSAIILDNYPGAIICLDRYGKILEFNKGAEQLSKYQKKDIYNKHIYELFPDKDLFKDNKLENIYKTKIQKQIGRKQTVYLLTTPLFDGNKKVGYTLIFHDRKYMKCLKKLIT